MLISADVGELPVPWGQALMQVHEIIGMRYRGASPGTRQSGLPEHVPHSASSYNIATPTPKRDWYRRLRRGDYSVFKEELEKWGERLLK